MEQRTNLRAVPLDQDDEGLGSSWRSFGSIASGLAARAEVRLAERERVEDYHYTPIAWAAE